LQTSAHGDICEFGFRRELSGSYSVSMQDITPSKLLNNMERAKILNQLSAPKRELLGVVTLTFGQGSSKHRNINFVLLACV
jgi:hypothetical protein